MTEEYVLTEKSTLVDMADALREASGTAQEFTIDELRSGVVNAVSNGVEKPWKMIVNQRTINEPVSLISIDKDDEGNSFEYDELAIFLKIYRTNDTKDANNSSLYITVYENNGSHQVWVNGLYALTEHFSATSTSDYRMHFKYETAYGATRLVANILPSTIGKDATPLLVHTSGTVTNPKKFTKFEIYRGESYHDKSVTSFDAGSYVTIWGR